MRARGETDLSRGPSGTDGHFCSECNIVRLPGGGGVENEPRTNQVWGTTVASQGRRLLQTAADGAILAGNAAWNGENPAFVSPRPGHYRDAEVEAQRQ